MGHVRFVALCLVLSVTTACAVSEPNPRGAGGDGQGKNLDLDSPDNPVVVMDTSMGTVRMVLYANAAPITVKNFLRYVDEKHYDGTIFHRVIPTFMIQGGGFTPGLRPKLSKYEPIKNEAGNGVSNGRGTLAMARTDIPDSATDQFFVNVENNYRLDRAPGNAGYAVFGRVTDGMDVVDKIRRVPTHTVGGDKDVPITDVMIRSIRRAEVKKDDPDKGGK